MNFTYSMGMKDGYITAFIDLIGFSNIVCNNSIFNMDSLNEKEVLAINYEQFYKDIVQKYKSNAEYYFLFVSDSIIICVEKDKIDILISMIQDICNSLLCCNISFRGGIASGTVYRDVNIWGSSVVNAVGLEKIANRPCIIVEKNDTVAMESLSVYSNYFKPVEYKMEKHDNNQFVYYDYFCHLFDCNAKEGNNIFCYVSTYSQCIIDNLQDLKRHKQDKLQFLKKKEK